MYFVHQMNIDVGNTVRRIDGVLKNIHLSETDAHCGDLRPLKATFSHASRGLSLISENLQATLAATTCASMRPLLEDLVQGASCTDSINGFTWLFSSLMAMVILGFTLLTTRAAMFNPVIPTNKKKRREKEFKLYREFMRARGYDTSDWKLDGHNKLSPSLNAAVPSAHTFETEDSTSSVGAQLTISCREDYPFLEEDSPSIPSSVGGTTVQKGLSAIREERVVIEGFEDDGSIFSFDSDDSSVHRPPGVMSTVASNLTNLVHHLLSPKSSDLSCRNFESSPRNSVSSPGNSESSSSMATFTTPPPTSPVRVQQYKQKIATLCQSGLDTRSLQSMAKNCIHADELDSTLDPSAPYEANPPSSQRHGAVRTVPTAPQKYMCTIARTPCSV